jgi:D-alanyl-D-alanine carboxypeptidase/D-alanyl-D-alanine-endopeptidase (penicillin-binding protein 4)
MRRHDSTPLLRAAFAALLSALPALALGQSAAPTRSESVATTLAAQIDAQIGQPRFAGAAWGIAVVSLDSGRTLYAHQAERLLQPASTAKLFTAALALDSLGADYRVSTRLLGAAPRGGRVDGPLVLYGMGDPTLGADAATADWADQLAAQLAAHGVRRIHGDLVADDAYFSGPYFGSGWEATDLQSWFAMPASALSAQENVVKLTVTPAATAGAPAGLVFDPADAAPPVVSRLATSAAGSVADINLYRAPGEETLYAFGQVPAHTPAQDFKLAIADPARYAGNQLLQALARHDIRLDGHLRSLHWPQDDTGLRLGTTVLGEVQSPPLGEILKRGLKRSQNLYLQNLLQLAGAKAQADAEQAASTPPPFATSAAWGMRALYRLLDRIGIAPSAVQLEEGTGLSRRDLVTPAALVRLLTYFAAQPYAQALHDDLPLAGVDGSLQYRLRNTPAENNLHAKTGSMNFVHCLAGYVTTAAGERLAFAVMLNNYAPPAQAPAASKEVDAIAVLLAGLRTRS